ncbi:MAG: M48 family metalloprotease [Xanthomonadales bacterium]|nr:M48 family metalloprotease [Xanthomonadales bacterium]
MIAGIADLAWMQALGWALIHFLWQGAIIGIVFALVRRLLPAEQSSLRYAFGLFSLLALLVAPVLTLVMLWPSSGVDSGQVSDAMAVNASLATPMLATDTGSLFERQLPVLVAAWLAGVLLMFGRAIYQWRALEQIARRLAWRDLEIEQMLLRVAERFGALPGVRVLVSASIETPTLIGWLKPVILLPVAVVAGFPRQQLELILAHELGHLCRYDHLVNLAQAAVETLLFYHPVVHWISREVRHEREICCDNLVLRLTDSEPREYARTLAALESLRQLTPQLAVAASGGVLLDRIRRIVGSANPHRHHRSRLGIWLVSAGCALTVLTAVLFSRADPEAVAAAFEQPRSFVDDVQEKPAIRLAPRNLNPDLQFAPVHAPVEATVSMAVEANDESASAVLVPVPVALADAKAVESPVTMPGRGAAPLAIAAIDAPDLGIEHAPIELITAADPSPAANTPKLVRMVEPDYPSSGFGRPRAKVAFEFSIDRSGRVRNIRSVSGDMRGPFALAARNALHQWKFDPQSVASRADEKFRQDFEFVGDSSVAGNAEDGSCATPMGSHVCRPGHPLGQVRKSDDRAVAIGQADRPEVVAVETADYCVPALGSHVCRAEDGTDPVRKSAQLAPTLKETDFLAGGAN